MKQKFSVNWKSSKQGRKQVKFRFKAPLHIKHKLLSASLSKELRKKYARRAFPIRKGDSIIIMKGKFNKKTGKIMMIDNRNEKVYIEGIQATKREGSKVNVPIHVSNLQIRELNLDDKKRVKALERKIKGKSEKENKTEGAKK